LNAALEYAYGCRFETAPHCLGPVVECLNLKIEIGKKWALIEAGSALDLPDAGRLGKGESSASTAKDRVFSSTR
jgi:hypothetical protein